MKAFSERNPIAVAITGMMALVLIVFATFNSANLPIIGAGPTYSADFPEAAGLTKGNDVLVAGVRVGNVSKVELQGTHVKVLFRVKNAWLGDQSTASIAIETLLGQKYLAIDPLGSEKLHTSDTIPLSRTHSPLDVTQAFDGLSTTLTAVNTTQLAQSFTDLSGAFANTAPVVRSTLTGLAALSQTIASRDAQIAQLVANTKAVTGQLAGNNQQVQALVTDGNLLVTVLNQRSAAITALLKGTQTLSAQLSGLVTDNQNTLNPALVKLGKVTTVLQAQQANLQKGLALIGPYYTLLDDALGNGRWLDTYACGLFTPQGVPDTRASDPTRSCNPQTTTSGGA